MKKILLIISLIIGTIACDSGFDELNTNPVDPISINPVFELNNAIIQTSYPNSNLVYDMSIVQQIITPNSGVLTGGNFNQDNRNSTENFFTRYYQSVIRHTIDVINQVQDDPERSNLLNMARIWQAYAFMVLTDQYGDVPYTEAGLGFIDLVSFPVYDTQESIYTDLINELTQASAALNASGTIETSDALYAGDVEKWRKLGNSLLLRAGMRLSKVDPARAQQVASAAFAAGVITSNDDNTAIRHDNNYLNGTGNILNATEANNYYLAKPFVDFLQNSNDPRLSVIAVRYVGAASGPEQVPEIASTDPSIQIGMPVGNDDDGAVAAAVNDGLASFYDYSQANRQTIVAPATPMFNVTYAQTSLLLAEAAHRGWINGDAAEFYNAGVRAHMEQLADYPGTPIIAPAAIDAFLTANPLQAGTELQQINEQYWIASFLNGPEAFANFRRSGFPDLAPNPFPGSDLVSENFIRRMTYPSTELDINENIQQAISRQGPDILDTRVWWDIQ